MTVYYFGNLEIWGKQFQHMRNTVRAKGSTELIDLQVTLGVVRRDLEYSLAVRNIQ